MNVITRGVRNAFRNGVRTFSIVIILGLSIGLALTMFIARQAVSDRVATVKSSIGNIISISPAGARGFEGGGNPLTTDQLAKVKALPHVTAVAETLQDRLDSGSTNLQSSIQAGQLGRRFNRGGDSGGAGGQDFTLPVMVTGTNSLDQALAGGFGGGGTIKLVSGSQIDPGKDTDTALVGKDLAAKNNLSAGSTFSAYGTTITAVGIYDAGNTFSNSGLVMPLSAVQRLSQEPGAVTGAVVTVDSVANEASAVQSIETTLGSAADVVSQEDRSSQALAPLASIQSISLYSLVGAVAAGAAIILLTMLMIVRERRREIGVLKAIGSSNLKVMSQFMTEAVTLTLMGTAVGLAGGALAAGPVTQALVPAARHPPVPPASAAVLAPCAAPAGLSAISTLRWAGVSYSTAWRLR